jgi:hypothetical protein
VPRKVALLAVLSVLAAPAAARAESLTVGAGSDPVAGLPNGIDYEYDTGAVTLSLQVVARPASGPPCQPTVGIDAAAIGASGGASFVTPTPLALTGSGLGRVPFTFPTAGPARVCAWLYRSPDDVVAVAAQDVGVRAPEAAIALAVQQSAPGATGSDLIVRATGTAEAAADLFLTVVPDGTSCPPTYDDLTDPTALDVVPADTATRVSGAFDLQFHTRGNLSYRRWRVCAYLQDGATGATTATTASAPADLKVRPLLLARPRARPAAGGKAITCDGGRFKARPAATLSYTWLKGINKVPGATGRTLKLTPALRGAAVRCRVTARNALGTSTATSKPVTVRR